MQRDWALRGLAVVAVVAVAAMVETRAQANVSGIWDVTLETHVGESHWEVTFEQDGGALSGEVDIGDREVFPLKGTVDGASIEFVFVLPDLDGDQPISLSGTVEGDAIAGNEGSFSWFGDGTWTGTRQGA